MWRAADGVGIGKAIRCIYTAHGSQKKAARTERGDTVPTDARGLVSHARGQTATATDPHTSRSAACPPSHDISKNMRKPDNVTAAQHRNASHVIAARHSTPPRPWSRPS